MEYEQPPIQDDQQQEIELIIAQEEDGKEGEHGSDEQEGDNEGENDDDELEKEQEEGSQWEGEIEKEREGEIEREEGEREEGEGEQDEVDIKETPIKSIDLHDDQANQENHKTEADVPPVFLHRVYFFLDPRHSNSSRPKPSPKRFRTIIKLQISIQQYLPSLTKFSGESFKSVCLLHDAELFFALSKYQ